MLGLILVYTGKGKGKTTAALGLALRAIGHGHRVGFLQFMKGNPNYGECRIAHQLPNLVLDEILVAVAFGLFTVNQVLDTLTKRRPHIDVVLTGRYAPDEIVQIADTVTEMVECRHAYHRGVEAKAGMEF